MDTAVALSQIIQNCCRVGDHFIAILGQPEIDAIEAYLQEHIDDIPSSDDGRLQTDAERFDRVEQALSIERPRGAHIRRPHWDVPEGSEEPIIS